MILKASQRGGAKQLGLHLMKTEENEHVEVHEVSGFVADDLMGAMKEAQGAGRRSLSGALPTDQPHRASRRSNRDAGHAVSPTPA